MCKCVNAFIAILLAAVILVPSAFADDEAPSWLRQAAQNRPSGYDSSVRAVVLHREQNVTLDSSGKLITVERHAVRILTKDGRREAIALAFYLSKFSQVRDMEAWLINSAGTVTNYGKKAIIDRISDPDDIYDEGRLKIIDASREAEVGAVFGFTTTTEDRPLFYQDRWSFQQDLPTLLSKFTLSLPNGWTANSVTFNRANVAPQVSGSTFTWELRDLPAIPDEPLSPSFVNMAPMLAINYAPPAGEQGATRSFADWTQVARWTSDLHDPQVIVDDAIAAKARDLTANSKTELEKIRAIGTFVQNLQYISIDIGVGYGNGMKPRPSNTVLNRGYGDCKDKANLMRAMLRVLKIESYPVAIYSGDPNFVKAEWASPSQFNHCIIAVKVGPETASPTVIDHPKLGRLLIFDATDQFTPVGDLPDYLQGSKGLIVAATDGGLVEMPVTPAEFNAWKRETEVTISATGGVKGVMRERLSGQESRGARTMHRSLTSGDFTKSIEGWLSRGATAARLDKLSPTDDHANAAFNLDVEFSAPSYAQLMQNRLLVFKPAVANRATSVYLTEKSRKAPVVIEANSFSESAVFNLPAGFVVDEMPTPVSLNTPFGRYSTTVESLDGKFKFTRSLVLNRSVVPVEKYGEVRDFFSKMLDAEQSPVVLIRK